MGYYLTSLYSIAPDDKHSYFVFYVGNRFDDTVSQWMDRNFAKIAKGLGPNAVIARGLSEEFDKQVIEAYQSEIKTIAIKRGWDKEDNFGRSVDRLLTNYQRAYPMSNLFPLLFVTDRNPSVVTSEDDKKVFYLIPLGKIESENEIREIIETIVAGIQSESFDALEKLLARKFGKSPLNLLNAINQSLELKPNLAGLGINLNAVIDWIVKGTK